MARIHFRTISLSMLLVFTCASFTSAQTSGPRVKIKDGMIEGTVAGDIHVFKGIPYAEPPVDNLRWRAPQPVKAWKDVRKATQFGSDCTQKPVPDAATSAAPRGEDCLVLNVWRPATAAPDSKLPVMVWIHGGGFVNGGSSTSIFDGSALARQRLIFVSINYRLGRLGFFAPPLLIEAKEGPVGNFGYMDQIQALKWVRDNIAAFGGDPKQVTIAGESAGGVSVISLLTSSAAKGLFHRVIVMSGGGRRGISDLKMTGGTAKDPSADQLDGAYVKSIGIEDSGAGALNALRSQRSERMVDDLNLQTMLASSLSCINKVLESPSAAARCATPPLQGVPMIDGTIITAEPEELFRKAKAADVPMIIGTTASDVPLYFPSSLTDPLTYFGVDASKARAAYNVPANPDGKALHATLMSIGSDITMHEPARFVARQMTAAQNAVWLYRFTYTAESTRPQATVQQHAGELPFLFQTLNVRYGEKVTAKDRQAAQQFSSYFANFVKIGNPNGSGLPNWPKFDPAQFNVMDFSLDNGPAFKPDPRPGVALVERVAEAQVVPAKTLSDLGDTAWQLVEFRGSDDTTLTPDDKTKYTLNLGKDGHVTARIDCNRGNGTWSSDRQGRLQFGPLAITRAMCPPRSLHDRVARDLPLVRSYAIKDKHLFLSLLADGGTYEFEPASGSQSQPQSQSSREMSKETHVTGTVTYAQRIALPPTAVIEVKLVDVSRADAASAPIAQQTINALGKQMPFAFDLVYDPARIDQRGRYSVQARIVDGSRVMFRSTDVYLVITGNSPSHVTVIVKPAGG